MIETYIDRIKTAVLGRDVKEAIAEGIGAVYDDAINAGNTAAEVQIARGKFGTLSERLDMEEEQAEELKTAVADLKDSIIISNKEYTALEEGQILIVYED